MFDETEETILERIMNLAEVDAASCQALAAASVMLEDGPSAHAVLDRIRKHLKDFGDESYMDSVDEYLEYVEDVNDILDSTEEIGGPLPELRDLARDHYETFLYNKDLLYVALNHVKRHTLIEGMRENYYLN